MVTDLTGADHEITVVDGWVAFAGTVVNDAEGRNAPGELHVTRLRDRRSRPRWVRRGRLRSVLLVTRRRLRSVGESGAPPGWVPSAMAMSLAWFAVLGAVLVVLP